MANIICLPTQETNRNELDAHNIRISFRNAAIFFHCTPVLPQPPKPPRVSEEVLITESADDTVAEDNLQVPYSDSLQWFRMRRRSQPSTSRSHSSMRWGRLTVPAPCISEKRYDFWFMECTSTSKPDVCIIDWSRDHTIHLTQEDKRFGGGGPNPSPQLVAEGIAAIQSQQRA